MGKNFVVARGNTKSQYCLELFEKEFKKNMWWAILKDICDALKLRTESQYCLKLFEKEFKKKHVRMGKTRN